MNRNQIHRRDLEEYTVVANHYLYLYLMYGSVNSDCPSVWIHSIFVSNPAANQYCRLFELSHDHMFGGVWVDEVRVMCSGNLSCLWDLLSADSLGCREQSRLVCSGGDWPQLWGSRWNSSHGGGICWIWWLCWPLLWLPWARGGAQAVAVGPVSQGLICVKANGKWQGVIKCLDQEVRSQTGNSLTRWF